MCTHLPAQLKDGRVSLNEVVVLQPAATASHPYLSAQHHPELLLEAVREEGNNTRCASCCLACQSVR